MVYILETSIVAVHSNQEVKVKSLLPKSYNSFKDANGALEQECDIIDGHYKVKNLSEARRVKLNLRLVDDDYKKVILISYSNNGFDTIKIYTLQIIKTVN